VAAPAYAFAMTFVLLKLIGLVMPLRVPANQEAVGLDVTQHGEEAYVSGEGAILVSTEARGEEPTLVADPA
jgi:Amt family ammonium transporter